MKKTVLILIAALLCLSYLNIDPNAIMSVHAETASENGLWGYSINDDGTATITRYTGEQQNVIVPTVIEGHDIKEIGDGHNTIFKNNGVCANINWYPDSLTIPESIKIFNYQAFQHSRFETINMPREVDFLGENLFDMNYYLKNIDLPENIEEIPAGAFTHCEELQYIDIPNNVVTIGA